jgi:Ca2+-dependent lipid-binding protein
LVHLQFGNTRVKSTVVPKTLNPEWNELFTFNLPPPPTTKEVPLDELALLVYDDDLFSKTLLGKGSVNLSSLDLTTQEEQKITVKLDPKGELSLGIAFKW